MKVYLQLAKDIMAKSKKQTQDFRKELEMPPIPAEYAGSGKLREQVALITGGDSGIGRSVAVYFAREGADVAIAYRESDGDAQETKQLVEAEGRKCLLLKGDIAKERFCRKIVSETVKKLGGLNVLVNNAGTHEDDPEFSGISTAQLKRTFDVNLFALFYTTKAALEVMDSPACIINTTSVTAYRGSDHLVDYAASKGGIVSFTRSLAKNLAPKGIRVNGVAPGPVWTPLIIASFDKKQLEEFGKDTPLGRAGYPYEVAPAYVYLASADAAYVTGQVLHVNGGDVVNG